MALSYARELPETKILRFADLLYEARNFDACITESTRFLFFHPESKYRFYAFYRAGTASFALGEWEASAYYFRQSLRTQQSPAIQAKIRYHQALSHIAAGNYSAAQLELFKLQHLADMPDSLKNPARIIYILILTRQQRWEEIRAVTLQIRESSIENVHIDNKLDQLNLVVEELLRRPRVKNPDTATWLSTFVPGLGQMYAGEWGAGINAVALNAVTTTWLGNTILDKNIRDTALIGTLVWHRFYSGNRFHARNAALRANQKYEAANVVRIQNLLKAIAEAYSESSTRIHWQEVFNKPNGIVTPGNPP